MIDVNEQGGDLTTGAADANPAASFVAGSLTNIDSMVATQV